MSERRKQFCPACRANLPIDSFGICRARATGRNLYCKACILAKMRRSRQRQREMKLAHKLAVQRAQPFIPVVVRKPNVIAPPRTPLEKVQDAIRRGHRTRDAIRAATKLSFDVIGDALADLLYMQSTIRIVRVGEEREFHPVAA